MCKDEITKFAHQPDELIKRCLMSGVDKVDVCLDLIEKGGRYIFSSDAGLCYMFNFQGLVQDDLAPKAFYPGPKYGLELHIDIQGIVT